MSDLQYYRPGLFPPAVKNLLIINSIIFLAQVTFNDHTGTIENLFALHDIHSIFFKPYQLVTYMFMHGSIEHLLSNMFALWMFGALLENHWGSKRFLLFYIACGLGAAVLHLLVLYLEMEPIMQLFRALPAEQQQYYIDSPRFKINVPTLGASGSVFGCLAAFGYLFPNMIVFFGLPMKAKWLVLIYAVMELFLGIQNSAGDNIAHFAHLGGGIAGFLIVLAWNKTNRKTLY